jgi:uncharacterized repeat protein (TIGR03803 family)
MECELFSATGPAGSECLNSECLNSQYLKKEVSKRALVGALALVVVLGLAEGAMPAQAQTFSVLYTFTGTPDGAGPGQSNLVEANGAFYSTTNAGGVYGFGAIVEVNSKGQEKVLYSFTGGADGATPSATLVRDSKGNLYGTAQNGGDPSCVLIGVGCGVVYKLDTTGKQTVLYSFTGGTDGANPQGVIIDSAGHLYGTTFFGGNGQTCPFGSAGCGVVYELAPQDNGWTETVLYAFSGFTDGATPNGFLTRDGEGNLYGATISGGNMAQCSGSGCGLVFKLNRSGKETPLYTFTGGADGASPNGSLLADSKGNLYGTAAAGGDLSCNYSPFAVGCGVVFELMTTRQERVMHTFTGGTGDGASPSYGLVRGPGGNFYSTTVYGGTSDVGTVFEVTAKGAERVLYSFRGSADGGYPQSGLVRDAKGNLYSNTSEGGDLSCDPPYGCGTVFELFP